MTMKQYKYKKVNAFTGDGSDGNPAAFLELGEDELTEAQYLAIAKEHAGFVSEIVFVGTEAGRCKLTYYSSECEVDFCGHGTIATMYELIKSDPAMLSQPEIRFETSKKGSLTAYNHISDEDSVYITAPDPVFYPCGTDSAAIAAALGIPHGTINGCRPIAVINAGLKTLIVPIMNFDDEVSMEPNIDALRRFAETIDVDIVLVWCAETSDASYFAHTRVFAPKFGYLEDPATGSGNSAFANYLHQNDLWDGSPIAIEQGGSTMRFNRIMLRMADGKVLFGGGARLKIEGVYRLS